MKNTLAQMAESLLQSAGDVHHVVVVVDREHVELRELDVRVVWVADDHLAVVL